MSNLISKALADLRAQQQAGTNLRCPRCGQQMDEELCRNALSRRQKGLYICSDCGMAEAIEDYTGCHTPLTEWAMFINQADSKASQE